VNDAMNPAWQYAVEMRHQRGIGSVIQPDIVQVIGRSLAEREDLLEVRNTACERIPPHVDDLRLWQRGADKSKMMEVGRHLVREMPARQLSVTPASLQILVAQRLEVHTIKKIRRIAIRIRLILRPLRFEPPHNGGERRQFAQGFDRRMARENLLHKCGTGSRKP